MVDISLKSGASWVCSSDGRQLTDVLLPVYIGNQDDKDDVRDIDESETDTTNWPSPVLLEQTEADSPCVLSLCCGPDSPSIIGRVSVVSEARTMEVYNQRGEYCGTVRGERDHRVNTQSAERGPFYRTQLILESPSSACEIKLLSLGGRSSVLVQRVVVCVKAVAPGPVRGPGIDMTTVQCLVDEMGSSLSPGAQSLMEMVQHQQKNQTGSLGGFLPLLMGSGVFSALTQAAANQQQPPVEAQTAQNGSMNGSSPPDQTHSTVADTKMSSAQLTAMMSQFLSGNPGLHGDALGQQSLHGNALGQQSLHGNPSDFLPMLQSVCDQVTKIRLDHAQEEKRRNGSCDLDPAMEARLEAMERSLKEHVDRRLDALEMKLEAVLSLVLKQEASSRTGGEKHSIGAMEETTAT